jgi:hypothetical protein
VQVAVVTKSDEADLDIAALQFPVQRDLAPQHTDTLPGLHGNAAREEQQQMKNRRSLQNNLTAYFVLRMTM